MKNMIKTKRIIILLCFFTVMFAAAFVFTDMKIYFVTKLKLITAVDPIYQYGSKIYIGDDYIIISTRMHTGKYIDPETGYYACLKTAAEMTEYMYALSENDFWGIDGHSVYIECGHYESGGLAAVESGIGYGTDGTEYSDGYMSTDHYYSSGRWITLRYFDDKDIKEKCMDILSQYEYDKIYFK